MRANGQRSNRRLIVLLTIVAVLILSLRLALAVDAVRTLIGANAPLLTWIVTLTTGIAMPFFCLGLAFRVAYARPRDPLAWLLIGLMISFSQLTGTTPGQLMNYRWLRGIGFALGSTWAIWMFLFGLKFPEPFPWEARRPWLKWIVLVPLIATSAAEFVSIVSGIRFLPPPAMEYFVVFRMAAIGLFFFFMGWKSGTSTNINTRRRLKLLWVGAAVGLGPIFIYLVYYLVTRQRPFRELSTVLIACLMCLPIFPATMAYVIFVHRAFDVRMVIRQGVKYALARGLVRLGIVLTMVSLAALLIWVRGGPAQFMQQAPIILPIVLLAGLLMRQLRGRIFEKIDQKFFREAYKAELILSELSESVRSIVEERPLMETVAHRISESLHVPQIAMLLQSDGHFRPAYSVGYDAPPDVQFSANGVLVQRLLQGKVPPQVDLEDDSNWIHDVAADEIPLLERLQSQLLLPLGAKNRMLGFVSLGPKRSEEPYSKTDVSLLQSVASQAALALENSRLTATVAREVAQRERLNREIEIAREVQQRLFPSEFPAVAGVVYAGACRPALGVGGDYFDFLALPKGDLGVVVGDVSGKGIGAALLMAALQASVRGQTIEGAHNLGSVMRNVNRLIFDATPSNRYATLFYSHYEVETRRLLYVNAGHNSPFVIRRRGTDWQVFPLQAGGLAVGLLRQVSYDQGELQVEPGDLVIAYTDGISEAMNAADEEWGEDNLIAAVKECWDLSPADMITALMAAADRFVAGAPQHDDMTLLVLKIT